MKKWTVRILTVIVILGVWFHGYNKNQSASNTISQLNSEIAQYKTKYDQLVSSKKSVELQRDDFEFLNDSLNEVVKNFKEPEAVIEIQEILRTDTIEIPIVISNNDSLLYRFKHNDGYNTISGIVKRDKMVFDPVEISNKLSVVSGYKKQGFFKKKKHYIDIINSNPYITTNSMTSFYVPRKKSWHEKWWISGAIGAIGGILITR